MSENSSLLNNSEIKAVNYGQWLINEKENISINCYVTNDGKRLMSLRGTAKAMELSGGGSQALIRNLKSIYLQPYLTNDSREWIIKAENNNINKIEGIRNPFIPLEAELFVDICDAYKKAKNDGIFNGVSWKKQYLLASKLDNMMTAFAKVGIIAFIDEITGYQEERKKDELQLLLAEFVRKEYLPWTRRFPPIFYEEIYRLKGWDYSGKAKKNTIYRENYQRNSVRCYARRGFKRITN